MTPAIQTPVFTRGSGLVFGAVFLVPGAVLVLAEFCLFAGFNANIYSLGVLGAVGSLFVVAAGGAVMLLLLLLKRARTFALRWLTAVPLVLLSVLLGARMAGDLRTEALETMATHGTPLAHAIAAYAQANGHAPTRLELLVPGFLPAIPEPGVGVAPRFDYEPGVRPEDPWRLFVLIPGVVLPDEFVYAPPVASGTPEREMRRRFGDWVYRKL